MIHTKISYMLRNVIIKNPKISNPPSTSSTSTYGSLFCAGTRHLYYGKFPPGAGYCVSPGAGYRVLVLPSALNIFYQYT